MLTSSKFWPTKSGTSSSSSLVASSIFSTFFPAYPVLIISFNKLIYFGPKCCIISGNNSLKVFVSAFPITTNVLLYNDAITSGFEKWIIELSSLNILTSSIPGRGYTPNFFIIDFNFLSSVIYVLWTTFFFLLLVPLPPILAPSPNFCFNLSFAAYISSNYSLDN